MFVLYLFVKVKLTIVICSIIFIQWNNYQSKCIFSLKLGIFNIIFLFFISEVENLPNFKTWKGKVIRGHFRSKGVHAPKAEKWELDNLCKWRQTNEQNKIFESSKFSYNIYTTNEPINVTWRANNHP